ncbi:hypothetical protein NL676_030614 [Syzygium grande]|nr:hypothetical protein NL676_030614 [Syzygium grande]
MGGATPAKPSVTIPPRLQVARLISPVGHPGRAALRFSPELSLLCHASCCRLGRTSLLDYGLEPSPIAIVFLSGDFPPARPCFQDK